MSKKNLGQFYTTNAEYILDGIDDLVYEHSKVIDCCYGNGDLMDYAVEKYNLSEAKQIKYDIDARENVVQRDTLMEPVNYKNMFLITNPPYLSNVQDKQHANTKYYEKYEVDDLFKCYIKTMINKPPVEFIIIIPVNFLCSIRKNDVSLRKKFFSKFGILKIKIFNNRVFDDTSCAVCCIHGVLEKNPDNRSINTLILPEKINTTINISDESDYRIGGEIYNLPVSYHKISRVVGDCTGISNIHLRAIDKNSTEKIKLSIQDNNIVQKVSDRSWCFIRIEPPVDDEKEIIRLFNTFLEEKRKQYNDLFLTNFRDNGRKRISFDLAYKIIGHILLSLNVANEFRSIPDIITKEVRHELIGISNIRKNGCEAWQFNKLRKLFPSYEFPHGKTHMRLNKITHELKVVKNLYKQPDFADWTEDFDTVITHNNKKIYVSLKFISEGGGAQNRSVCLVADHISAVANYIHKNTADDSYFIFITDGEYINTFNLSYYYERVINNTNKIYIGSMKNFYDFYLSVFANV